MGGSSLGGSCGGCVCLCSLGPTKVSGCDWDIWGIIPAGSPGLCHEMTPVASLILQGADCLPPPDLTLAAGFWLRPLWHGA